MRYQVFLTEDAQRDLEELHEYLTESDSPASAASVLERVLEVAENLATFPERGSYPKELLALGIREYRQTFFKPYRVIYRLIGNRVSIYLIADGRRDMQALLFRRLLEA
jgi:toxin ParE1/3/4